MADASDQIKKFWNELGINQRVSLGLAAFAVILGMVGLLVWSGQPEYHMLWGNLDAKDMASVVEELQGQGIEYQIKNGSSIYVKKEKLYEARMDLASKGVPTGGSVGFEIFDRNAFGISDFVQRTNKQRAIQGELQRTIEQVQYVRSARVLIVTPQNTLLVTSEQQKPTATVQVDTGGMVLQRSAVNSIRHLVANSVESLNVDDVVVTDTHGNYLSEDLSEDKLVGAATGQFKFRKHLEDYFTTKVESMLTRVVGDSNVVARVSVELDTEAATVFEETFDPNGQVLRNSNTQDESNTSNETKPSGTAGVESANAESAKTVASNEESTSQGVRKNKQVNYEIGKTITETVRSPGTLKTVTAAVFIAKRYIEENGEPVLQPRTEEELNTLKEMIFNTLGTASRNNDNSVSIQEIDFAPQKQAPTPTTVETVADLSDAARNYISAAIAVIVLIIFLRVLKRHKPEPISLEVIDEQAKTKKQEDDAPKLTPELLNELIREKPENVSTALKNWAIEEQPS